MRTCNHSHLAGLGTTRPLLGRLANRFTCGVAGQFLDPLPDSGYGREILNGVGPTVKMQPHSLASLTPSQTSGFGKP